MPINKISCSTLFVIVPDQHGTDRTHVQNGAIVEQEGVVKSVVNVVNEVNGDLLWLIVVMDPTACNGQIFIKTVFKAL